MGDADELGMALVLCVEGECDRLDGRLLVGDPGTVDEKEGAGAIDPNVVPVVFKEDETGVGEDEDLALVEVTEGKKVPDVDADELEDVVEDVAEPLEVTISPPSPSSKVYSM